MRPLIAHAQHLALVSQVSFAANRVECSWACGVVVPEDDWLHYQRRAWVDGVNPSLVWAAIHLLTRRSVLCLLRCRRYLSPAIWLMLAAGIDHSAVPFTSFRDASQTLSSRASTPVRAPGYAGNRHRSVASEDGLAIVAPSGIWPGKRLTGTAGFTTL